MIGIFKQKTPANILLLLFFGIAIKLPMFLYPHIPAAEANESPAFQTILHFLNPYGRSYPQLYPVLAFLLLYLQSVLLSRAINNRRMTSQPGYLPGMSYMLITSLFPQWNYFSPCLIVSTFYLYILAGIFKIYNQPNVRGTMFNSGLAAGFSIFLFPASVAFIVWIFLALAIMRPFRLYEWIIFLIGITTPYYFYGAWLFLTDHWDWQKLMPRISLHLPDVEQSPSLAAATTLIVIPFLMGGYYVQDNLRRMLIQVRKGWSLFLLYLLIVLLAPFMTGNDAFENWVLAAIPLAAFHACTYLYASFRIIPVLIFCITLAFIFFYQYYLHGWQ